MRTRLPLFALFACLLTSTVSAQQVRILKGGDYFDGIGGQGPIQGGQGVVYWVQGPIRVPAGKKLTLSFVTFKFNDGTGIQVDGALNARGYFTSIHDDKIVGDTNFNGGATVPAPGNWTGITFTPRFQTSLVQGVIRYAGRGNRGSVDANSVSTPGPDLHLSELTVIDSRSSGLKLGSARSNLWRCNIIDCGGYAAEGSWPHLDRVKECTARGNKLGDFLLRSGNRPDWPSGNVTRRYDASMTFNSTGVFVARDHVVIPQNGSFSLAPGSVLKMTRGQRIIAYGNLNLRGSSSSPIVVTSLFDDSVGGDTNKDLSATSPAAGDWGCIYGNARAGVHTYLEHLEVRYAGSYFRASVVNSARDLTMNRVTIRDSSTGGVNFLGNSTRGTHRVTNCRFEHVPGLALQTIALDSLASCFGNVHERGSSIAISSDGLVRRSCRIDLTNVPERVLHLAGSITPPSGVTVTLGAGLVVKSARHLSINGGVGEILVDGTPSAPVLITSLADDTAMGDTNGDGSRTQPAPGNWTGIRMNRQCNSKLRFCTLRYASVGVDCSSPNATMQGVRVDDCSLHGFRLSNFKSCSNIIARGSLRSGIRVHWSSSTVARDITHATVAYNGGYGVERGSGSGDKFRLVNSIVWKNTLGSFNSLVQAKNVWHSCGGFANQNGNIDVDPRFADPKILGPYTNSPCLNRGEVAAAVAAAFDIRGNSRISDWDYTGSVLPDMGAIELVNGRLQDDKPYGPRIGETITFRTSALRTTDAGVAIYLLGLEDLRVPHPQYGMLNAGLATLMALGSTTSFAAFPMPIPQDNALSGARFAVQSLHIPTRDLTKGNFTNIYRAQIRP